MAKHLPEVKYALEAELKQLDGGIKISKPIPVPWIHSKGDFIYVSVSHEGVFAIYNYKTKTIEIIDVIGGRRVYLSGVDKTSIIAFYDKNALLLTWKQRIKVARVVDIFAAKSLSVFTDIDSEPVDSMCDVTRVQMTRRLYYRSTFNNKLYMLNVDTLKSTCTEVSARWSLSTTGVSCGYECIINVNGKVCGLDSSGKTTEFADLINDPYVIVPSDSNPNDITKAAIFTFQRKYNYKGNNYEIKNPVEFNRNISMARVYKDVFILYDNYKEEWVAVRILVP